MFKTRNYIFIVIWIVAILAVLGLNVMGASAETKELFSNGVQTIFAFAAAVLGFITAFVYPKGAYQRPIWRFFALGMLFWAVGNTAYLGYLLVAGRDPGLSFWGHFLYLAMYLCFILAFMVFFDQSGFNVPYLALAVAGIIIGGGIALNYYLEMFNVVETVPFLVSAGYGVLSPVVFGTLVLIAITILLNQWSQAWWFMIVGMAAFYMAEMLTLFYEKQGTYVSGGYISILWILSFGFIAMAAMVSYNTLHREVVKKDEVVVG